MAARVIRPRRVSDAPTYDLDAHNYLLWGGALLLVVLLLNKANRGP
jgi:hypothetical protein